MEGIKKDGENKFLQLLKELLKKKGFNVSVNVGYVIVFPQTKKEEEKGKEKKIFLITSLDKGEGKETVIFPASHFSKRAESRLFEKLKKVFPKNLAKGGG